MQVVGSPVPPPHDSPEYAGSTNAAAIKRRPQPTEPVARANATRPCRASTPPILRRTKRKPPKQKRRHAQSYEHVNRRTLTRELEGLYRVRYPQFLRVATAIAGDEPTGHDAVQEAFARALKSRRTYRAEGTLEAWVWPIVINAARAL